MFHGTNLTLRADVDQGTSMFGLSVSAEVSNMANCSSKLDEWRDIIP